LKISRDYKFFLKVACVFLVVSIFLPFAIEPTGMVVFYNPGPTWPSGVSTSQTYRAWTFRWSFMNVRITTPEQNPHPYDADFVGTQWLFLLDYWSFYPPTHACMLGTLFALQAILIPLHLFILKKAKTPLNVLVFFLGVATLLVLSYGALRLFNGTPSFGFWLVIVATLFTLISFARTKKWI